MDPISNVDRLVLLLRQRLSERSTARHGAATAASRRTSPPPADVVRALAAVEGMDERHLRRALIQSLLSDAFGKGVVNEAQFQQVVDRVTQTIEDDPDTARLLQRVVGDLRIAAR
jgi:hypothetical protein